MNQLELKDKIAALLPEWQVTVDEANMVNVKADGYTSPFVYIEEFDSGTTEQTAVGMRRTRKEEIYFCKLCDMHNDGEARVTIRETLLRPAMDKVIKMLNTEYGVLKTLKAYFDPDYLMNPGGTIGLDLKPEEKRFLREHKEYVEVPEDI